MTDFARKFAVFGVLLLLGASIWIGGELWLGRGEPLTAIITAGCEIVAFAGLVACWKQSGGFWVRLGLRALGVAGVLLAAGWVVFSTYEKLSDDAETRAINAVKSTPVYVAAESDWIAARSAANDMSDWIAENPPIDAVACRCPTTIKSRQENMESEHSARREVEAERRAAMLALIPPATIDWVAIYRSLTVEFLKLFGLLVFGAHAMIDRRLHAGPLRVRDDVEPQPAPKLHAIGGGKADLPPPRQRRPL